jgi:hypothetical protein
LFFIKYYKGGQIQENEISGACKTHGEMINANKILTGMPEGKTPIGIPRRRWEDNIKMDLREQGWEGED